MTHPILERIVKTARHTTFFVECGRADATPLLFVHGWPALSSCWLAQLPVFAALGFRCIAPDLRGYGRSSQYTRQEDYAVEPIVTDMLELLDALGIHKAIWVGHDTGSPIVWAMAQHHADRCHGVANLCVPYLPNGFGPENAAPLADRAIYPVDQFPYAQWDYQLFYREHFQDAVAAFDANVRRTVKSLFRAGSPTGKGQPTFMATVREKGGWFGASGQAPDYPRDFNVLSEEDENRYTAALERTGFFGPCAGYISSERNSEFALAAKAHWRLSMPVLFLHATYDYVCATVDTKLAEPMRAHCSNLTEATVLSGHWMPHERPSDVSAGLAKWLSTQLPHLWLPWLTKSTPRRCVASADRVGSKGCHAPSERRDGCVLDVSAGCAGTDRETWPSRTSSRSPHGTTDPSQPDCNDLEREAADAED